MVGWLIFSSQDARFPCERSVKTTILRPVHGAKADNSYSMAAIDCVSTSAAKRPISQPYPYLQRGQQGNRSTALGVCDHDCCSPCVHSASDQSFASRLRAERVREKASNSFHGEESTERVSNSPKSLPENHLQLLRKESIVTKRVAIGELRYEARKEPPYWLTQNAVSPSLRRFAFIPSLFKDLRRFGPVRPDSLSEPVALRVREQTSWFGTHPERNPPKLSQSLFNKRCYLTTRLLSHPWSNAFGKMAGGWSVGTLRP